MRYRSLPCAIALDPTPQYVVKSEPGTLPAMRGESLTLDEIMEWSEIDSETKWQIIERIFEYGYEI